MSIIEVLAVITALFYVYFASKQNRKCFIFGFISSAIYIYITINAKLYFDSGISFFYVIMSVIGWFNWGKEKNDKPIKFLNAKLKLSYVLIGICITALLGFLANQYTDAALPYFDAFTTTFSIIGTIWLIDKYIENWIVWIVVDFVSIGMYFYKELHLTSALFLLYTIIAIYGFRNWKKELFA